MGKIVCYICDKTFKRNAQRDIHVNTVHHKLKMYSCPHCSKTFGIKGNCQKHLEQHFDSFFCDQCPASFSGPRMLANHFLSEHGIGKDLECYVCGHNSSSSYYLTAHFSNKHQSMNAYLCPLCPLNFRMMTTFKKHFFESHFKGLKSYNKKEPTEGACAFPPLESAAEEVAPELNQVLSQVSSSELVPEEGCLDGILEDLLDLEDGSKIFIFDGILDFD